MLEAGSLQYVSRQTLIELVGLEAAERVVKVFGGRRFYVPEPSAAGFPILASRIGDAAAAQTLARQYGGGQIVLPKRVVPADDGIMRLHREMVPNAEIARRLNYAERYVYAVLARNRKGNG